MPLVEHLRELRNRLVKGVLASMKDHATSGIERLNAECDGSADPHVRRRRIHAHQ